MADYAMLVLAVVLIVIGLILLTVFLQPSSEGKTEVKAAGLFMIGPIPVILGDKSLVLPLAIAAIVLMVLWFFFFRG